MMPSETDDSASVQAVADNDDDPASQSLSDADDHPHDEGEDDEDAEAFKSSHVLHDTMLGLAVLFCCVACIVPGARLLFASYIVGMLICLAVRQAASGMRDQRLGRKMCGRWALVLANLQWFTYHSATDAPVVFNERPFLLVMGIFYLFCYGIASTLVTTPSQQFWISILILAHNAYAQSLVPEEKKLFSDVEAAIMTLIVVLVCICYYVREARSLRVRLCSDKRESMARKHVEELDRQLTALEHVRREALVDEAVAARRARRRRGDVVAANASATREVLREPSIPEATAPKHNHKAPQERQ